MFAPQATRARAGAGEVPAAKAAAQSTRGQGGSDAQFDFAKIAVNGVPLRRKLAIGDANDPSEAEADSVAERVMRTADAVGPVSGSAPAALRRKCAACESEDETSIRRQAGGGGAHGAAPSIVHDVLSSAGHPLDTATRSFMEPRFGHDFSGVRVHSNGEAGRSASAVDARAYTVGQHIVFAPGRYAPETPDGRHLLAHELAHVVQASGSAPVALRRQRCGHDGQRTGCVAGSSGRWSLVDMVTKAVTNPAFDKTIVEQGLRPLFPGNWLTELTIPVPNKEKSGEERSRIDGTRISAIGELNLEIVEVKARSPDGGGCALASKEAQGYVNALEPLTDQIVSISQKLAAVGGLRIPGSRKPNASELLTLQSAGVDLSKDATEKAWRFYNGLQNRLDTTFNFAFTAFHARRFAEGAPGKTYPAGPPVLVDCKTRNRKPGVKKRQLGFQVNGAGGVSYGCEDTPCQGQEEEKKEQPQVQPVAQPQEQPQAQPQTQPKGERKPDEDPKDRPVPEPDVPVWQIMAGAAGATMTAAAIAAAKQRAARIAEERIAKELAERAARQLAIEAAERAAARNVINLAEARAARQAAARIAGEAAGKVATRAVIAAEVAAAVYLLASGKAEARVGIGPSALEALYSSMTRNGTPPSPEMKALIESDPVLRQAAEQAAQSGDMTPLQEAAARHLMEIVHDNPGKFTAEELEILRQASNGTGSSPQTAAELRAAIDAAALNQAQPGGTSDSTGKGPASPGAGQGGTTQGTGPTSGTAGARTGTPGGGSGDLAGEVNKVAQAHPKLSPEMQGQLAAAPPTVRAAFEGMAHAKQGVPVDDALVRGFLATVPSDLTESEKDTLLAHVRPSEGESAQAVLESLRSAVQTLRAGKEIGAGGSDKAQDTATAEEGKKLPPAGTAATAEGNAEKTQADRTVKLLQTAIESYKGWDDISTGRVLYVGSMLNAAVGSQLGLYAYGKGTASNGTIVRYALYLQVRVTRTPTARGQIFGATVISSTPMVGENGAVAPGYSPDRRIGGPIH